MQTWVCSIIWAAQPRFQRFVGRLCGHRWHTVVCGAWRGAADSAHCLSFAAAANFGAYELNCRFVSGDYGGLRTCQNDIVRVNSQVQGILSILVIGAATDYSLLYICALPRRIVGIC